jgi:hypothetical protein
MTTDAYSRFVLTVIAVCLVYLCVKESAPPASAQQGPARVVISGIDLGAAPNTVLPVAVVGSATFDRGAWAISPLEVRVPDEVRIRALHALKIEADKPLLVEVIKAPGTQRPGQQ